jgi:predicted nucleic acid-binding protein
MSGSEAIVSGDKDLLRRGEYQGIKIVRVSEFLEWRPPKE